VKKKIILFSTLTASLLTAQTISSIEYKNLNKISPKIINEMLDLNEGENVNEDKINNALKKFYEYGYFDDITVDFNNNGKLVIDFKEKPSISNIEIKGYKERVEDKEELYSLIGIKKGTMYTPQKLNNAKKILLKALEDEGYINSVVEFEEIPINDQAIALTIYVNKGDEIIIRKANYYGAKELDGEDFDNVTANNEQDAIPWLFGQNDGKVKLEHLNYDARRINEVYLEKGFLDAKVESPYLDIDFASNNATVDFFIQEGNKYKTTGIKIYIDPTIAKEKDLLKELNLIIGNTFSISKLRKDQNFIKTTVKDKGYAFAQVRFDLQKDEKTSTVNVVYSVIPGNKVYVNDVKISGNSRTLDRVIRRYVYLASKDLYNLTELNSSKKKLQRSGYFDKVKIEEKRISEDKIDLIINVEEAATGNLTLGGGYGSSEGFMLNGSLNDVNIFGSGLSLGLSADLSSSQTKYSVNLKNPSINDSKYNGAIDIHNIQTDIDRSNYDLEKETKGFYISAGKEFFRNFYSGLKYRYDIIEENYEYDSSYTGAQASDTEYVVSSITPYINFDNTDNFYLPREGFKIGASAEFAGLGGDSKYIKTNTYLKYFHSIEDLTELDWIFRFRTQVKFLVDQGQINQGDSFYMGGPRTLRGYSSYAFGPEDALVDDPYKKMWTNALELNFPLVASAKLRWGLFYDFGMIGTDKITEIKRSGTGAVVEWISPIGPLQFIFSKAVDAKPGDDTSSFEFSLGASF
jgi:outer membrane protein insertion porin family